MSYVDAGYAIALSVLALYAAVLLLRRRRLERAARFDRPDAPPAPPGDSPKPAASVPPRTR
jgi:uncharacterized protein (TIGR03382 family)